MSYHNDNYKSRKRLPKRTDEDLYHDGITLIRNAIKARQMAEPLLDSYKSHTAETADVNWVCYMMAQSIELFIKGLLGYYGEYFREGHFVGKNSEILENLSGVYSELRELQNTFDTLSNEGRLSVILFRWSNISRYKDIRTNPNEIALAENVLEDLHAFVRRNHILD